MESCLFRRLVSRNPFIMCTEFNIFSVHNGTISMYQREWIDFLSRSMTHDMGVLVIETPYAAYLKPLTQIICLLSLK